MADTKSQGERGFELSFKKKKKKKPGMGVWLQLCMQWLTLHM